MAIAPECASPRTILCTRLYCTYLMAGACGGRGPGPGYTACSYISAYSARPGGASKVRGPARHPQHSLRWASVIGRPLQTRVTTVQALTRSKTKNNIRTRKNNNNRCYLAYLRDKCESRPCRGLRRRRYLGTPAAAQLALVLEILHKEGAIAS